MDGGNEANCIWLVRLLHELLDELYSHASHTLCREEGSGHAAAVEFSPIEERTQRLDNKMLTSAKHIVT